MSETVDWEIGRLLDEIENAYEQESKRDAFDSEKKEIEQRLLKLGTTLASRYNSPVAIAVGGQGIILKLNDSQLPGYPVALKFSRPVSEQTEVLNAMIRKEIEYLTGMRHPSIVRVHRASTLTQGGKSDPFSYYIMDFVSGSDSSKFFLSKTIDQALLISILSSTIDLFRYLHDHGLAYLDIKAQNILIDEYNTPIISDLGTIKLRDINDSQETIIAVTRRFADPKLLTLLDKNPIDPDRNEGRIPRKDIDPKWDLVPLGWTILNWLGFDELGNAIERRLNITPYCRKYLMLMAARLFGGRAAPWLSQKIGLSDTILADIAYDRIEEVGTDVNKISGSYSLGDLLPELNQNHIQTIRVSRSSSTTYTERIEELIDHPRFRRLKGITQLGLISNVYPTATHSRFEHSLGTYHNTTRYILSLYNDPLNPLFRQLMTLSDLRAVLLASLLHDIGQYPMAHDLEAIDDNTFSHERLSARIVNELKRWKPEPMPSTVGARLTEGRKKLSVSLLERQWDVNFDRVLQILTTRSDSRRAPIKDRILHSIIDGPIDADKLDYLERDAYRLRVPYPLGIDFERILRCLTVVITAGEDGAANIATIGVHEKAKVPAEFVVMARYAMFSQAYWHHSVRAMKAMLYRATAALLVRLRASDGDRSFRQSFEEFVLSLPGVMYTGASEQRQQSLLTLLEQAEERQRTKVERNPLSDMGNLAASDVAVLRFLESWLEQYNLPEAALLAQIANRQIFKRLFVFTRERSPQEWDRMLTSWNSLDDKRKRTLMIELERIIVSELNKREGTEPETESLRPVDVERVLVAHTSGQPIILIDVPEVRTGSSVPLFYVVEAQRRALRKMDLVLGTTAQSDVWSDFGAKLHERAGKVRVFCHPEFVDVIEAVVESPDKFLGFFKEALARPST